METRVAGIIGALEEEIDPIRSIMDQTVSEEVGGFSFNLGLLEGRPIALVACGIGKVNAAVACTLLIERYKPELVVSTGSAGGISSDLAIGDVVVPEELVYHDVDVTGLGFPLGQVPGRPAAYPVSGSLAAIAERTIDGLLRSGTLPPKLRRKRGSIATGDAFIHDETRIRSIRRDFPQVLAVEMESAAIAQTCASFSTPLLVIRSISDVAGKESPLTFSEFLPLAAKHSCEIVKGILGSFPEDGRQK